MIEISQYRSRIGTFSNLYRNKNLKFKKYEDYCSASQKTGRTTLEILCSILKVSLLLVFLAVTGVLNHPGQRKQVITGMKPLSI